MHSRLRRSPAFLWSYFFFFLWNLAILGNHAALAHAIHSWAKWKPNMRARGRALAAILRRWKRHNRKRSGSSRCHGSLFSFMKTMSVDTGTGRRGRSTLHLNWIGERIHSVSLKINLLFTNIYILLKSSITVHQILRNFPSFLSEWGSILTPASPF